MSALHMCLLYSVCTPYSRTLECNGGTVVGKSVCVAVNCLRFIVGQAWQPLLAAQMIRLSRVTGTIVI